MPKAKPIELLDPIVEEIHATRFALLKEHGGLAGLVAYLRQQEQKRAAAKAQGQVSDNRSTTPDSNSDHVN